MFTPVVHDSVTPGAPVPAAVRHSLALDDYSARCSLCLACGVLTALPEPHTGIHGWTVGLQLGNGWLSCFPPLPQSFNDLTSVQPR
jgi:hypothetical protein